MKQTPVRAIRANCLRCQGGSRKAVRECAVDCPLHSYRMGKNPNRAGIGPKRGSPPRKFTDKGIVERPVIPPGSIQVGN